MTGIEIWNERLRRGKWTSAAIELPPVGEKVAILQQEGEVNIAKVSNSNTWYDWQIAFEYGHVTHWMPVAEISNDWPL